jgi:hypothetical protein
VVLWANCLDPLAAIKEQGMNIYQRINEVRKAVDYIRKDKKVEGSGYMAVTHDAVTALTRDHFIAHGVLIVPSLVSSAVVDTGTVTAKGTPFIRYEARYRFDVVNADEPADKFSLDIESHALDQGDKAPGKALSYAKKYAVLKLLEIESGEGEEDRPEAKPAASNTARSLTTTAMDNLTAKRRQVVYDTFAVAQDHLNAGQDWDAYSVVESAKFDTDEKLAIWSLFSSTQRARLTGMSNAEKNKQKELDKKELEKV